MFQHDCLDTCCFECLLCKCFVFLYLQLFGAIEHVSHGKAFKKYGHYYYHYHYHHHYHHHHYYYYYYYYYYLLMLLLLSSSSSSSSALLLLLLLLFIVVIIIIIIIIIITIIIITIIGIITIAIIIIIIIRFPYGGQVANLERTFAMAKRDLDRITREVNSLEAQLSELNRKYEMAMSEKQALEEEERIMLRRLAAAEKLMSGLGSESVR